MYRLFSYNVASLSEDKLRLLPPSRLQKATNYLKKEDRLLSFAASFALEEALESQGVKEKDVEIIYGENNKPYIKDRDDLYFNLSHSGEVAIAVVSKKELGCDIEKIRPYSEEVAKRCFAKEERAYINKAKNKDEAFTRIWVYKESFIKAIGKGLALKLSSFSATPTPAGIKLIQNIDPREWIIEEKPMEGYILAVCYQK